MTHFTFWFLCVRSIVSTGRHNLQSIVHSGDSSCSQVLTNRSFINTHQLVHCRWKANASITTTTQEQDELIKNVEFNLYIFISDILIRIAGRLHSTHCVPLDMLSRGGEGVGTVGLTSSRFLFLH